MKGTQAMYAYTILFMLSMYPLILVPNSHTYAGFPKYIALAIVAVLILFIQLKDLRDNSYNNIYISTSNKLLFLFMILLLLSSIFAFDASSAFAGSYYRKMGFSTYLYCVVLFMHAQRINYSKNILRGTILCGTILSIIAILQNYGIMLLPFEEFKENWRPFATMGNPNFLATYVLFILPASLLQYLATRKPILLYATCLLYACLLVTVTRGAWLTFLVILPLILLFYIKKTNCYLGIKQLLLGLILTTLILLPSNNWLIFNRALSIPDQVSSSVALEDSGGSSRMFIWKETIKHIPDNWLIGIGLDNLQHIRITIGSNSIVDKVHNIYLEILISCGIFSLLLFLLFLYK
ncbi:MAG: O-antigen ligase family protein, partial [Firmicutes bacterium]|nr:O-antigen ligase family protein [Bacillota bacterium]